MDKPTEQELRSEVIRTSLHAFPNYLAAQHVELLSQMGYNITEEEIKQEMAHIDKRQYLYLRRQ